MANPTFRAAGTQQNGSGTTISVPPPAGHQTGDLLILFGNAFAGSPATMTTPSGWTLFASASGDSGAWAGGNFRTYVWWKLATSSSEPNVSVVQSVSSLPQGQMFAVQGTIDQTTPIDVSQGWGSVTTGTTASNAALTTVTDNALVVYLGVDTTSGTWSSPPNGATKQSQSALHAVEFIWCDFTKTPAGAVSSGTTTRANGGNARVFEFAVRPAGGGGGATFIPQIIIS
jgi:hypothetical protein